MELVVAIIAGLVVAGALIFALFFMSKDFFSKFLVSLLEKNEESRRQSKEEIDSGVKTMLEQSQQTIDRIIKELRGQLRESHEELKNLRGQNAAIRQQLLQTTEETKNLRTSTDGLRSLLTNNRLRGEWGEQVAEDLLLGAGFVEGIHYTKQTTTEAGRPDFTFQLPDGQKLNVDAKFPLDDLIAYQEATSDAEKKRALQSFQTSMKEKVKQITSKDYINPEAGTLDLVVMFIPNEMIFSFIYEKLPSITQYCIERKVALTGPFGFTAVLRLVLQAHKNFRYEKGLHEILGLIHKFQEEYQKFGDSMEKLGRQIEAAQKVFYEVEGTRSRRLTRVVEKIGEHSVPERLPEGQAEELPASVEDVYEISQRR